MSLNSVSLDTLTSLLDATDLAASPTVNIDRHLELDTKSLELDNKS